jgi:hypothetical protein
MTFLKLFRVHTNLENLEKVAFLKNVREIQGNSGNF